MGAPFSAVNGQQIVAGKLLIPACGLWTADLVLAGATTFTATSPVTVTIGNLTLAGTVYRSATYGGQTSVRCVAGGGGWRTQIQPQGYGDPSGVKLSTVLNDAALAAGETVNVPSDTTIGKGFARCNFDSSVAGDILWQMVALNVIPAWYVDATGKTQAATWPSNQVSTPFTATDQRPDHGVILVATEDYVSWMPGCTFTAAQLDGTFTSAGVHYVWEPDGQFRFEVMTGSTDDRVLGPIQQVIQKELAPIRFFGRYAFTISNPTTTTIDATPVNAKLGLPTLQNVPLVGWSVGTYTPPSGGKCRIEFVDGDPTQAECTWTDETPTMAAILSGTNPVARLGDQVQVFLPPGLPIVTSQGPGTITAGGPMSGAIIQGSQQVNSA